MLVTMYDIGYSNGNTFRLSIKNEIGSKNVKMTLKIKDFYRTIRKALKIKILVVM